MKKIKKRELEKRIRALELKNTELSGYLQNLSLKYAELRALMKGNRGRG